jgi:long-chain acyl-CoA synthetase
LKLTAWAESQGVADTAPDKLIAMPQVHAMIEESIAVQLKGKFGGYEIPRKIVLVDEPFSVDNGMLTQTLKLKRRKVVERYGNQIEAAYA